MKELKATARNLMAHLDDETGKPTGSVEVILILSEVGYGLGKMGGLAREMVFERVSFAADSECLRALAVDMEKAADDLDRHVARLQGAIEEDTPDAD